MDDNGHGTHVAGTIGAQANGGDAVGVAWNVKLIALKFLDMTEADTLLMQLRKLCNRERS